MYIIKQLYSLEHSLAGDYLSQFEYPWQALAGIKEFIVSLGKTLDESYEEVKENVWVHKSAMYLRVLILEHLVSLVRKQK